MAWMFCEPNPIALNTALAMCGAVQPVFRLPYMPLSRAQRELVSSQDASGYAPVLKSSCLLSIKQLCRPSSRAVVGRGACKLGVAPPGCCSCWQAMALTRAYVQGAALLRDVAEFLPGNGSVRVMEDEDFRVLSDF